MQRFLVTAAALATVCAPHMAFAQGSPQSQKSPAQIQQRVKNNLEQAGFKNVQIMPSSFLVRATDRDGNPVMMVINPDSITAVTDVTADQQRSQANSATSSSTGSSDQLKLTSAQRNEIWKSLSSQTKETPPNGFTAKVGEAVPSALHLQPLPSNVTSNVPAVKSYDFAMLQNEVLLVDPSSKKIVDIVTE